MIAQSNLFKLRSVPKRQGIYQHQVQAIEWVVPKILQTNFQGLQKIVLFGSCARKTAKFDSDIDIMLILSSIDEIHDDFLNVRRQISNNSKVKFDIHAMHIKEWKQPSIAFYRTIQKEGVFLWEE